MVRLDLGSGATSKLGEGWKRVDICPDYNPDECYDLSKGIREGDSTVDEIFMGDFLEHIPYEKTVFVLLECFRVLKPGGTISISTPDMGKVMAAWLSRNGLNHDLTMLIWGFQGAIVGEKNLVPDTHFNGFTKASLTSDLELAGFRGVTEKSINGTWFELAVEAHKPW